MIQHLITIVSTLTGVFISYGLTNLYKQEYVPPFTSEDIEITEYVDIWSDI